MLTLRLADPNGYTVPGGLCTVDPETEAQARQDLEALAVQHATEWADFGYHHGDYQILSTT